MARNAVEGVGLARYLMLAGLVASACSGAAPQTEGEQTATRQQAEPARDDADAENLQPVGEEEMSVSLRLREAEGLRAGDAPSVLEGEPVTGDQAEQFLTRLPDMPSPPARPTSDPFPEASPPAPRAGKTIETTLGERGGGGRSPADEVDRDAPFEVVRKIPTGEVDSASRLSVTFSKPMVLLAAQDPASGAEAPGVPLTIEPAVEGSWRWVGTKTIVFEPEAGRFPMSSSYEATIDSSAQAADGKQLGETLRWSFETESLKVVSHLVGEKGFGHADIEIIEGAGDRIRGVGLEPVFALGFNQRIDRNELVEHLRVWGGGETFRPYPVSSESVEGNEALEQLIEDFGQERSIVFRVRGELESDTTYQFGLAPGAVGLEGNRATSAGQYQSFSTYPPLEYVDHESVDGRYRRGWTIRFNNKLSRQGDIAETGLVSIEPRLPERERRIIAHGERIGIVGAFEPKTTYTVTVSGSLQDKWGQSLGDPKELTFDVGSESPDIELVGRQLQIRAPDEVPRIELRSVGSRRVEVTVYRVNPDHWPAYTRISRPRSFSDFAKSYDWPGEKVSQRTVELSEGSSRIEKDVSFRKALGIKGYGHAIIVARIVDQLPDAGAPGYQDAPLDVAWIQVTDIGLDAFVDRRSLVGWASSLSDGTPLEDVSMTLSGVSEVERTDRHGTVEFELPPGGEAERRTGSKSKATSVGAMLLASHGDDAAFLPRALSARHLSRWERVEQGTKVRWYLADDRQMYRPGERAVFKGWIRGVADDGRTMTMPKLTKPLRWRVVGPRGNELRTGEASLTEMGGFSVDVRLPEKTNLGRAWIEFKTVVDGEEVTGSDSFQMQAFRTPTFETKVDANGGRTVTVGEQFQVGATAEYFSGGGVSGAHIQWRVRTEKATYEPPQWEGFSFGPWSPWWRAGWWEPGSDPDSGDVYAGRTSARGEHRLSVGIDKVSPIRPIVVNTEATVTDVTRQSISGRDAVLVHPARHYVGLRTDKRLYESNEQIRIQAVATSVSGDVVEDRRIDVRVARLEWAQVDGEWRQVRRDPRECELTSASEPVVCRVSPEEPGAYQIRATVRDDKGRSNVTEIRRWVTGAGGRPERSQGTEMQQLTMVPGASSYQPGETAKLLIRAPFDEGHGRLVFWRDTMSRRLRFELDDGSATVEFPIESADIPKITMRATVVGREPVTTTHGDTGPASDTASGAREFRPALAEGGLELDVPPKSRRLDVRVRPSTNTAEPGGSVETTIEVTDAEGGAVDGAEVALFAVDEAVLSLSDYSIPSPMEVMYRGWHPTLVETKHARRLYTKPQPVIQERRRRRSMARAVRPSAGDGAVTIRENLTPLAHVSPALRTNADGEVTTTVSLPDNLTRYRVVALAAFQADSFGRGTSQITARKSLTVRPSMPRFLNHGDEASLPILVRNQTSESREITLGLRSNNLEIEKPQVKTVQIEGHQRAEVRFVGEADRVGESTIQILAEGTTNGASTDAGNVREDAVQLSLPVYAPATSEAFAAYGSMQAEQARRVQPVRVPDDSLPAFGELTVTTSSTILQALTDAVVYLVEYPYACTEQLGSRVLSVSALYDVLESFETDELPGGDELRSKVGADLKRMIQRQSRDGGFAYWDSEGEDSWPFVTVHALHAIGVHLGNSELSNEMRLTLAASLLRGGEFLREIEDRIPDDYSRDSRLVIKAYAHYVKEKVYGGLAREAIQDKRQEWPRARRKMTPDTVDAGRLVEFAKQLTGIKEPPLEAVAWGLSAAAEAIERLPSDAQEVGPLENAETTLRRILDNRAVQEGATAQLATDYREEESHWIMASDRRVDALALEAFLRADPDHPLIPKLTRALQANRIKGRWASTQENVFVLLALRKYFELKEQETPEFVARLWLGDRYAGEQKFSGRTTERRRLEMSLDKVREVGSEFPLTLEKSGKGRMYYRIGLSYAPDDYDIESVSRGFSVERHYTAVDSQGGGRGATSKVKRTEEGWEIEAGTMVRIRLTMVAPARRYHVALVDRLPAGFEPINPVMETAGWIPPAQRRSGKARWWGSWYGHQNLRDSRAEAFSTAISGGVYTYTYTARATTPGRYHVPPAKAEEMYTPEVYGRTESKIVEVVPEQ